MTLSNVAATAIVRRTAAADAEGLALQRCASRMTWVHSLDARRDV